MNVKAVIFDYGEVLCHPPAPEEIARLASYFGVGLDVFPALWERNRGAYDRGDLTSKAYWSMMANDTGAKIGPVEFEEICQLDAMMWSNINSAMVDWANTLRSSGMKVGILSNMHADMVAHCRNLFPWIDNFDFATFSGDVRLIKPEPAIYEHTLRGLGVRASEVIFLDDRQVNIQAARALGIRSIQFRSLAQLRSELQREGFAILPASS